MSKKLIRKLSFMLFLHYVWLAACGFLLQFAIKGYIPLVGKGTAIAWAVCASAYVIWKIVMITRTGFRVIRAREKYV